MSGVSSANPDPVTEAAAVGTWDDVSRALALASDRHFVEGMELREKHSNPSGLSLREMLEAVADPDDMGTAFQVLSGRAGAFLEDGLTPDEARRYLLHASQGLVEPKTVIRALDQALLLRRDPDLGRKLERALDPEARRRSLEEQARRGGVGLKLGIEPLDALINGGRGVFPGQTLHIVGSEGSLKTALALHALTGYAASGGRALLLSLDMAPERIEERRLQRVLGVDGPRVRELIREGSPEYRRACRELEDAPVRVLGGPLGEDGIRAAALLSGAEVVALDYVTAVRGYSSELEAARGVSELFRELTRRWGLTGLLLSQMSRASRQDQERGGRGGHAMGGGSLEQFVDFEVELFVDGPGPALGVRRGGGDVAYVANDQGLPSRGSPLIATLRKNRSGEAGVSWALTPEYPGLTFLPGARPMEPSVRRRSLFKPSGVV